MKNGEKDFAEPKALADETLEKVSGGAYCSYKVKPGDSLQTIAVHLGVSQSTLITLNGIKNPDLIYAGQSLKYPC